MSDVTVGPSSPFDRDTQATEHLTEKFVGLVQEARIKRSQEPTERSVFRKLHGTAYGRLECRAMPRRICASACSRMTRSNA